MVQKSLNIQKMDVGVLCKSAGVLPLCSCDREHNYNFYN